VRKRAPKITITTINLKYRGQIYQMDGLKSEDSIFSVTIPFTNRQYSNYLTDYLSAEHIIKSGDFDPVIMKSIEATQPFKVISVEPTLPTKIAPEERVEFKIKIQGPDINYIGPMTLEFIEENREFVHLEITNTSINFRGKEVIVDNSLNIMNLLKNGIFEEGIQLLRVLDYGTKIEAIDVAEPFKFEGSFPKPPFIINDRSSFILTIYIKAPPYNYSGPLIVKLS
jgi:hypothetical protein